LIVAFYFLFYLEHESSIIFQILDYRLINPINTEGTTMIRVIPALFFVIFICTLLSQNLFSQNSENPPAKGFNLEDSDQKAIQIANEVMKKLGGRKNWDNTHYITWNFFGSRRHVWNKWNGDLRIEEDDAIILMNLNSRKGNAWKNGEKIEHPDSLQNILDYGYQVWVNDSYWMFMPYKLKDTGVTLKYKGEGSTIKGTPADILELTFKDVGVTPHNKYLVYVDTESHLVRQWDYFRNANDGEPLMQTPWNNWKQYGDIMLSPDRGEKRHMTDIAVFEKLPEQVFESPKPFNINELIKNHN
jgi:hypothetical protein